MFTFFVALACSTVAFVLGVRFGWTAYRPKPRRAAQVSLGSVDHVPLT